MHAVGGFESLLIRSGIRLFKFYLEISRSEQKRRLAARRSDPLKQRKTSPIDASALSHWDDYSSARDAMFARTDTSESPWIIVRTDNKKLARVNIIRYFLSQVDCPGKREHLATPDPAIVFPYVDVAGNRSD